jgi:hypothetical protein
LERPRTRGFPGRALILARSRRRLGVARSAGRPAGPTR